DASQFVHDELELAKLELREVATALSSDVREAGQTLGKDIARVGMALSLALMAGLALTAGAVLGIGRLLGGEYWAGGLITGVVLLIGAAMAGKSAASDAKESRALRLENTRETIKRDSRILASEARETKDFAQHEAQEFKRHATGTGPTRHRH
ncbi:MAG: phage holin family protein, partial [Longimicrobiales bacterium]